MPWGETRYTWGNTPTDYTYTGQRSEMDSIGLMYYNARWYDPALGRFAQADTIVPGMHPMAFDRYAGMMNNPVRYVDPSGHFPHPPRNPMIEGLWGSPSAFRKEHRMNWPPDSWPSHQPPYKPTPTSGIPTPDPTSLLQPIPTQDYSAIVASANNPTENAELDVWYGLRQLAGEYDPIIPGEFTGTNLGYDVAVQMAAEALAVYAPYNPYSKYYLALTPFIPIVAAGYDIVYDQATNTGEYSEAWNIRDITPMQGFVVIVSVLIILPIP